MEKAQNLSSKMSYINLINGDLNDPLCNLARAIMATRVNEQLKVGKKKPRVIWSKELNQAIPLWELSTTNYAIASLTFTNTSEKKIKVTSNVFGAGSTDKDGKKSSAISPEDHSERSALADVINQAIFEGWPQGQDIGKLKKPYSMENLQKYSKALGTTNIILFSEKEPCNRKVLTFTIQKGVNTCSELLQSILTPKKYELYHTINWDANQKQEFTNDVKLAREEYYKILDYSIHQKWIEEHKDAPEVQKAIKYGENLKRLDSVAEAPKTAEKKVAKKQRTESKTTNQPQVHQTMQQQTKVTSTTTTKTPQTAPEKRKREIESASTEESDFKRQKTQKIEQETGQMMRQQQSIAPKVEDFQFSLRSPSNTTTSQVARHSTAQQNAFLTQVQQQPVSSSTKTKKRAKKGSRPSQEGKF